MCAFGLTEDSSFQTRRWREWRTAFDPSIAEVVRPAERVVKAAAFRAICASTERANRIREILERAGRDIENFGVTSRLTLVGSAALRPVWRRRA